MIGSVRTRSALDWLRAHARLLFLSWDAYVGYLAAILAGVVIAASDRVATHGVTLLLAVAAIAVALFAVVLAAMAIFATFFDDSYRQVLQRAGEGSIRPALFPYEVVGVLAGLTTLISLLVALAWPGLPVWGQVVTAMTVFFLAGWSIAGSIRLVFQTAWHAERRAEMMKAVADARAALEKRRRQKPQGDKHSTRR
jgi:amino acid transporter